MLTLPLVLAAAGAGCIPNPASSEGSTVAPPQEETSPPERTAKNVKVAAPLPSRDAPGKDIPDLPRYPDSVRVEYERSQLDALILTRMRYLSDEKLDTVRGFYRGVFQSEDWRVANAEFSDGEWTFLAVKGDREAAIEVRPHDAGVETDVRLSEPVPPSQPEEDDSSEAPPPERDKSRHKAAPPRAPAPAPSAPATAPATATATATATAPATAPATVPPATVPPASGGYGYDDDDGGDDNGGEYEDDD